MCLAIPSEMRARTFFNSEVKTNGQLTDVNMLNE